MFTYRNLMTVGCAAVLALGLAACGSSDNNTAEAPMTTEPTPTPMPMEPTPVAVAVADFMYLDEDNMPMAGMHEIAAGMTATSGGVTYLCAEGGDDCTVTIADDGSATSTGGMVSASLTAAAAMQVTEAKEMTADMDEADRIVRVQRVIGEDRAIEGVSPLARGAPSMPRMLEAGEIRISRADGAMASIRVNAATDTALAGYAPSETPAMANGDWTGARLSRPITGGSQQLVSYTDIDGPRAMARSW